MANTVEYAVSKGFNKNIFIERDEAGINEYDVSKFGMEFFPGNEILVPGAPDVPPTPVSGPYLIFNSAEPFSISTSIPSKSWNGTIEYSTDTKNWNEWRGTKIDSSEDGRLYFRGSNNTKISMVDPYEGLTNPLVLNGNAISCSGNIENLLDYQTVANGEHPQMGPDCYNQMFYGCASLTTAPELPAMTLAENCYTGMFTGCTSLTTAPKLPAIALANYCYSNMFYGCSSLTAAPELPATTLAVGCYTAMFSGCTSITTPPELPAMTLEEQCYSTMFGDCTSLITAPELPATTLARSCYLMMFYNCTSLKLSTIQDSDYTTPYRIPKDGTGTDAIDALVDMFASTGGTFTGTPTINTTYYLHKDNSIV